VNKSVRYKFKVRHPVSIRKTEREYQKKNRFFVFGLLVPMNSAVKSIVCLDLFETGEYGPF